MTSTESNPKNLIVDLYDMLTSSSDEEEEDDASWMDDEWMPVRANDSEDPASTPRRVSATAELGKKNAHPCIKSSGDPKDESVAAATAETQQTKRGLFSVRKKHPKTGVVTTARKRSKPIFYDPTNSQRPGKRVKLVSSHPPHENKTGKPLQANVQLDRPEPEDVQEPANKRTNQGTHFPAEAKLITLIQTYGSRGGTRLPLSDIPKYYCQHFRNETTDIQWPHMTTFKMANYKSIRLKREHGSRKGAPFVVQLVPNGELPNHHGSGKVKKGPKKRKTRREPPIPESEQEQDPGWRPVALPRRTINNKFKEETHTSNHTQTHFTPFHEPTPSHSVGDIDITTNNMDPTQPVHTKTSGILTRLELEVEQQRLEEMRNSNAIAVLQMKVPHDDVLGQELIQLMKREQIQRLQHKVESVTPSHYLDSQKYARPVEYGINSSPKEWNKQRLSDPHLDPSHSRDTYRGKDERRTNKIYDDNSCHRPRLSRKYTDMLLQRIRLLVNKWAYEESKRGIKLSGEVIMNDDEMMTVANTVPSSIDELISLKVMARSDVTRYGDRLLEDIQSFVYENDLRRVLDYKSVTK